MVWVIIGIVLLLGFAILFLIGLAVTYGAMDEFQRELEDREQEEYIRRWVEKRKAKMNKRKKR